MRVRRKLSDSDWVPFKVVIREIYLVQDKTLKEVMNHTVEIHDFYATCDSHEFSLLIQILG